MNRKEFLDNFRKHIQQLKDKYPNKLKKIEYEMQNWGLPPSNFGYVYINQCPFLYIGNSAYIELGWGEIRKINISTIRFLGLFKEQSRYFIYWSNSKTYNLEYQMIQVYCEVVYDDD